MKTQPRPISIAALKLTACAIIVLTAFQNCGPSLQTAELASSGEEEILGLRADGSSVAIRADRSVMIVDHKILDKVKAETDFGHLLGQFQKYMKENRNPGTEQKAVGPGDFVARIFDAAAREQREHASLKDASQRIGDKPDDDRYMDRVFKNWMPMNQMVKVQSAEGLKNGPFRLLAIGNLMDEAGNIDDRGTIEANRNARALGELHLIYGMIDKDYENRGKAFPQTFVLTFRLPIIGHLDENFFLDRTTTMHELMQPKNVELWRRKMRRWAQVWARLSEPQLSEQQYLTHLRQILNWVVRPENLLNVRANTKINESSFELREWYLLNTTVQLIPRRPRNEPYPCASGGSALTKLVNHYWYPAKQDLDVFTYKGPSGGNANNDKNGFTVWRDNGVKDFIGMKSFDGCPSNRDKMPYDMASPSDDKETIFVAPFATIKNEGRIWKLSDGVPEERRHAFAIRTCSGCHSQEGAAKGFHIEPRLEGKNSRLSSFLTGAGQNTFKHAGVTYRYEKLKDRRKWLRDALEDKVELFEGLRKVDTD